MARTELTVFSAIGLILILLPLPSKWRERSVPMLAVIFWIAFLNLFHFINSIVWRENTIIRGRVYCDIVAKLSIGAIIGTHIAYFCIIRRLESIASGRNGVETPDTRRRRHLIDAILCVGAPCLIMILHYIVQGHRFDIYEDFGCDYTVYWSWPAILIIHLPPLLVSFLDCIYGGLAIYWLLQQRSQFNGFLATTRSGVTRSKYIRLICLAFAEMVFSVTIQCFLFANGIRFDPLLPYTSWADVHFDFGFVQQVARALFPERTWSIIELSWWIAPVSALLFFVTLGTSEDALSDYRTAIDWIWVKVLRLKPRPAKNDRHAQLDSGITRIKFPMNMPHSAGTEAYDLEAVWPNVGSIDEANLSPKKIEARRQSVPETISFWVTASQYTISDRGSVILAHEEARENAKGDPKSTYSTTVEPDHPPSSMTGDRAV